MRLQRCYNHNFKFLFWQQQIARPPVYDVVTSKCVWHFYSRSASLPLSITFDSSSHHKSCHSCLVTESHVPLWKQKRCPRSAILIGAEANWFWVRVKDGTSAVRRVGLLARRDLLFKALTRSQESLPRKAELKENSSHKPGKKTKPNHVCQCFV